MRRSAISYQTPTQRTRTRHPRVEELFFICEVSPSEGALQVRSERICRVPVQSEWLTRTIGLLPCFEFLHQSARPEERTVVPSSLDRSIEVCDKPVRHNH